MTKVILASFLLFCLPAWLTSTPHTSLPAQPLPGSTQVTNTDNTDLDLARRYVPAFYFHPDEIYLPQPVDVALGKSRLRQSRRLWFDTNILNIPTEQDLSTIPSDETYFLDEWFGDTGSSDYSNYTAHQAVYEASLSPQTGGPAPMIYAHVVRTEYPNQMTIQYWVFYFYKDSAPGSRFGGCRVCVLSLQTRAWKLACSLKNLNGQLMATPCRLRSSGFSTGCARSQGERMASTILAGPICLILRFRLNADSYEPRVGAAQARVLLTLSGGG